MASPPRRVSRLPLLLTLGLTAVSLLFFVFLVDLRAVAAELRAADGRYLAAASLALLAGLGLYAVRWWWLLGLGLWGLSQSETGLSDLLGRGPAPKADAP